jgi:hypothetical protein
VAVVLGAEQDLAAVQVVVVVAVAVWSLKDPIINLPIRFL